MKLLGETSTSSQDLPDHDITLFDLCEDGLRTPRSVAGGAGYDNQPFFSEDGGTVYFTRMESDVADIWSWSETVGGRRVVASPLSEFSPTVMPAGGGLSTVRVEADGTQRLWSYSKERGFRLLFNTIKPVGYHAWSGHDVALFVLGEPHRLEVARLGSEQTQVVAEKIGRCLKAVPGRRAVSFTVERGDDHILMMYDFETGEVEQGRPLPRGVQDYDWLNEDTVVTSNGTNLLSGNWKRSGRWSLLHSSLPLQGVSRLAVSADGKKIAIVHLKRGWLY